MAGVEFDFSELMLLAADLDKAGSNIGPFARKAVEVTARNVKDDAQVSAKSRRGLGHAAAAIDYELKGFQGFGATVLDAEIGYNKSRRGGALGNLIEFGAPNSGNQLSPSHDLGNALLNNQDDFERGMAIAADDALKAASL